jgi:hypothetical protein
MPDAWSPTPNALITCPLGFADEDDNGWRVRPHELGTVLEVHGAWVLCEFAGPRTYYIPLSLLAPFVPAVVADK